MKQLSFLANPRATSILGVWIVLAAVVLITALIATYQRGEVETDISVASGGFLPGHEAPQRIGGGGSSPPVNAGGDTVTGGESAGGGFSTGGNSGGNDTGGGSSTKPPAPGLSISKPSGGITIRCVGNGQYLSTNDLDVPSGTCSAQTPGSVNLTVNANRTEGNILRNKAGGTPGQYSDGSSGSGLVRQGGEGSGSGSQIPCQGSCITAPSCYAENMVSAKGSCKEGKICCKSRSGGSNQINEEQICDPLQTKCEGDQYYICNYLGTGWIDAGGSGWCVYTEDGKAVNLPPCYESTPEDANTCRLPGDMDGSLYHLIASGESLLGEYLINRDDLYYYAQAVDIYMSYREDCSSNPICNLALYTIDCDGNNVYNQTDISCFANLYNRPISSDVVNCMNEWENQFGVCDTACYRHCINTYI